METAEFNKVKERVLDWPLCYREVEGNELIAQSKNHYSIGHTTFEVEDHVSKVFDQFAGIKPNQNRTALTAYGEQGLTDLRNFFGQAGGNGKGRLVLIADTNRKQVVNAVPIKGQMIMPLAFFSFAEMFMDKNGYLPDQIEYDEMRGDRITIRITPVQPQIMSYAPGDDFISNGMILHWTPGEISLSNYFVRLVCSNGQTMTTTDIVAKINSFQNESVEQLLDMSSYSQQLGGNTQKMLDQVNRAMECNASVRELGQAFNALYKNGVEPEIAQQIIPYQETLDRYLQAGYDKNQMARAMSELNMWDVLNRLTYFATHNHIWSQNDTRRTTLMGASAYLLMRERDIVNYYNIY